MLRAEEVAEKIILKYMRPSEAGNSASITTQPGRNDPNTEDPDALSNVALSSFTPAGEHSREECIVAMLGSHPWTPENEAVINVVNEYRQNLAHLCAQLGYNQLLLYVIEWGIDIRAEDANGWTPLDFARLHSDESAVDILEGDWVDPGQYEYALQLHDMTHDPIAGMTSATMLSLSPPLIPLENSTRRGEERPPGAASEGHRDEHSAPKEETQPKGGTPSKEERAQETTIWVVTFESVVSEASDVLKPIKAVSKLIKKILEVTKVSFNLPDESQTSLFTTQNPKERAGGRI
jgi:hypothetical protein